MTGRPDYYLYQQGEEHIGETVVMCGLVVEQRTHRQITGEPTKFLRKR